MKSTNMNSTVWNWSLSTPKWLTFNIVASGIGIAVVGTSLLMIYRYQQKKDKAHLFQVTINNKSISNTTNEFNPIFDKAEDVDWISSMLISKVISAFYETRYSKNAEKIVDKSIRHVTSNKNKNDKLLCYIHGWTLFRDSKLITHNRDRIINIDNYLDRKNKNKNNNSKPEITCFDFSWPSDYFDLNKSQDMAYICSEYLQRFIDGMIKKGYTNITFMAHSMGTRLVCNAFKRLNSTMITHDDDDDNYNYNDVDLSQIKMICLAGEADDDELKNLLKCKIGKQIHITNYFNNKDWVLSLSNNKKYGQIGDNYNPIGKDAVLLDDDDNDDNDDDININCPNFFNINCENVVSFFGGGTQHSYMTQNIIKYDLRQIIIDNKTNPKDRNNLFQKEKDKNTNIWTIKKQEK